MKKCDLLFLILVLFAFGCSDDDSPMDCGDLECGENIDAGQLEIDFNSNFAYGYPGAVEVVFINDQGEELWFANDGTEEELASLSYLNCANSCSSSQTSLGTNIETLTRRSGDMEFTYTIKVGIIGEVIGEEPFFFDYVDVINQGTFVRVFLQNRRDREVDESRVNIFTSFNEEFELNGRTFQDVYSSMEGGSELHYNFVHGVIGFRNNPTEPLWVFDRTE